MPVSLIWPHAHSSLCRLVEPKKQFHRELNLRAVCLSIFICSALAADSNVLASLVYLPRHPNKKLCLFASRFTEAFHTCFGRPCSKSSSAPRSIPRADQWHRCSSRSVLFCLHAAEVPLAWSTLHVM